MTFGNESFQKAIFARAREANLLVTRYRGGGTPPPHKSSAGEVSSRALPWQSSNSLRFKRLFHVSPGAFLFLLMGSESLFQAVSFFAVLMGSEFLFPFVRSGLAGESFSPNRLERKSAIGTGITGRKAGILRELGNFRFSGRMAGTEKGPGRDRKGPFTGSKSPLPVSYRYHTGIIPVSYR